MSRTPLGGGEIRRKGSLKKGTFEEREKETPKQKPLSKPLSKTPRFLIIIIGIAGWLMLIVWKPFVEGDYIKIGDIKGEVDKITLMSVMLKNTDETDSSTAYIPNSTLFDQYLDDFGGVGC